MLRRHKVLIVIGLAGSVLLACVGVISVFLSKPQSFIEYIVKLKTNRPASIGSLHIIFADPIHIDLDDFHLGNAEWGSAPDMLHIGYLSADIHPGFPFGGHTWLDHVILNDSALLLERDSNGVGNWKFSRAGSTTAPHRSDPIEEAKRSREGLPTIAALALHNSTVSMRTSSGAWLKIGLDDVKLETTGDDRPVTLTAKGSYNGNPVQLEVVTQSFAIFHDTNKLFGADIIAKSVGATIKLSTRMMDPLNFDRFEGTLKMDTKRTGMLGALFGSSFNWNIPLTFESAIARQGDNWSLTQIEGKIAANPFGNSQLTLIEGARLQPDNISPALNFNFLDIDSLLPKSGGNEPFSLPSLDKEPGMLVDGWLNAKHVIKASLKARDVKLHASLTRGAAAIDTISMLTFGGTLKASLSATARKKGNSLSATLTLLGADISQLLNAAGINTTALTGKLNAGAALTADGQTANDFRATSNGTVIVAIDRGAISRRAFRLASINLGAIFSPGKIMIPVNCMLARADFRNGTGRLSPFYLKTTDGNLAGTGTIALPNQTLDLTFQTDKDSTSALALDAPIRITGSFNNPAIVPKIFSDEEIDQQDIKPAQPIPRALQPVIETNSCYKTSDAPEP